MYNREKLNSVLDRFVSEETLAGCGMQVFRDNQLIYDYCTGASTTDGSRPMSQHARLRIYSVSKTFTCAGLMTLYEKGLFALDDAIANYLPEFSHPVVCVSTTDMNDVVPAETPITIRHLLTMTSGIAYEAFSPDEGLVQDAMLRSIREMEQGVTQGKKYELHDLVSMIAQKPLCFQPGEHWMYGFSHTIIGRLIEVLSGKRLSEYLLEAIWEPLGLTRTCFNHQVPEGEEIAEQTVAGALCKPLGLKVNDIAVSTARGEVYGSKLDVLPGANLGIEIPCGGMVSTLHDLGVYNAMLANGGIWNGNRILSRRTIDLMRKNQLGETQLKEFTQWENNRGFGYGLGYRTMRSPAEAGFYVPEGSFGWDGATGCYALASPEHRLAVIFVEQSLPHHIVYTIPRVVAAFHAAFDG